MRFSKLLKILSPDQSPLVVGFITLSFAIQVFCVVGKLVLRINHKKQAAQNELDTVAYAFAFFRVVFCIFTVLRIPVHRKSSELRSFSALIMEALCGHSVSLLVQLFVTSGLGFAAKAYAFSGAMQNQETYASAEAMLTFQAMEYLANLWLVVIFDNAWQGIKTMCQFQQLTQFFNLFVTVVLHITYSTGDSLFSDEFNSLRMASLGSFLAYRIFMFNFFKFKADYPMERYCDPVHRRLHIPIDSMDSLEAGKLKNTFSSTDSVLGNGKDDGGGTARVSVGSSADVDLSDSGSSSYSGDGLSPLVAHDGVRTTHKSRENALHEDTHQDDMASLPVPQTMPSTSLSEHTSLSTHNTIDNRHNVYHPALGSPLPPHVHSHVADGCGNVGPNGDHTAVI